MVLNCTGFVCILGVLDCCIDYVVWTLIVLIIRRIWNHGGAVGDDNLGPTWNS